MDRTYITVNDAAAEVEVSRATMWKWIKRHALPTFRFMGDRKTYIQRSDLDKLREPVRVDFQKKRAA
jgi:excisionase family DNA binding protein